MFKNTKISDIYISVSILQSYRRIYSYQQSKKSNVTSRFLYNFYRQIVRRRFGFHVCEQYGIINFWRSNYKGAQSKQSESLRHTLRTYILDILPSYYIVLSFNIRLFPAVKKINKILQYYTYLIPS